MSTAMKFVLAMLAAGGFAVLSLIFVTRAALQVALCGLATAAAGGLLLFAAFTMPEPVPVFTGMVVCIGSVACLIRSLLGFADALDRHTEVPASRAREYDVQGRVAA